MGESKTNKAKSAEEKAENAAKLRADKAESEAKEKAERREKAAEARKLANDPKTKYVVFCIQVIGIGKKKLLSGSTVTSKDFTPENFENYVKGGHIKLKEGK